jgi:hypothetical protein
MGGLAVQVDSKTRLPNPASHGHQVHPDSGRNYRRCWGSERLQFFPNSLSWRAPAASGV